MHRYILFLLISMLLGAGIIANAQEESTSAPSSEVTIVDQRATAAPEQPTTATTSRRRSSSRHGSSSSSDTTATSPRSASSATPAASAPKPVTQATDIAQLPESQIPIGATKKAPAQQKSGGIFWQIINTIFRLVLVLIIAYIVMLILKKYANGEIAFTNTSSGIMQPRPKRMIRVLESVSLGQGRSISLVAVGTQYLLVGICGQQMTLLKDVTGENGLAELAESMANTTPVTPSFMNTLARFMPNQFSPIQREGENTTSSGSIPSSQNRHYR